MRPAEIASRLAAFTGRGPGTDAEWRTARWLVSELDSGAREANLEPFWCRPNWAFAHVWHVALALAGSLVSVSSPRIGGALILVALLSIIADALIGQSPGRRLTLERASQNVVSRPPTARDAINGARVRLIITANYDAGRAGLVYRPWLRALASATRRPAGDAIAPGRQAWLVILCVWLLVTAIFRLSGAHGTPIGVVQLAPTAALVLALALLVELATASYSPAAADNGSGCAVAIALARALDAAPPRNLGVELVLQGSAEGGGIGIRRYLRARRKELKPGNTVVLGIAPCAQGTPRWWISDGSFIPMRYLRSLRDMAQAVATSESYLRARGHRGRGATPALGARAAGLPAIAIGCLDEQGLVPYSHAQGDTTDRLDPAAMDATLELALALVDGIDAEVGRRVAQDAPTRA